MKKIISLLLALVLAVGMLPVSAFAAEDYEQNVLADAGECWDGTTLTEPAQVEGVYQIGTGAELAWFAQKADAASKAVLTADIDLNNKTWTAMAKLSGSFDGQGHTIQNLNGAQGLFNTVYGASNAARAEVKNVTVEGNVSGGMKIAGIAGSAYWANFTGVINRANVTGTSQYVGGIVGYSLQGSNGSYITLTNCGNEGTITGSSSNVAGLVAYGKGAMVLTGCYNTGAITGSCTSYSGGGVGGLVGYTQGYKDASSLTNCYNTGSVNGKSGYAGGIVGTMYNGVTATNCYNTGTVTGGSGKVGAITGYAYNATSSKAVNCYYLEGSCAAAATGKPAAVNAGTTVKTADEMQGVGFVDILGSAYKKGETYPALSWEAVEIQTSAYTVTPPTHEGIAFEGAQTATDAELYRFSIAIQDFYEVTDTFAVKINGTTQTAVSSENRIYRFEYTAAGDFAITVEGVQYTGVTLDKAEAELYPNQAVTLTATVDPNAQGTVTWASDNEAVATVNNGVVTAIKAGQATITASIGGETGAMFRVTVLHAPTVVHDKAVSGMNWMTHIQSLTIHDVTVKEFRWKGDTCVVTLDKDTPHDAVVRFVKTGSAGLTINGDVMNTYRHALENGYLKLRLVDSTTHSSAERLMILQVDGVNTYVPVERIEVTAPSETLMRGHSMQLNVKVYPENASIQDIKFSMQDPTQQTFGLSGATLSVTENQYFLGKQTIVATSRDDASVTATVDVTAVAHSITEETAESCTYERIQGTQTHRIDMTCSCGQTDSKTVACADGNADGKCDKCGAAVTVTVEGITLDKTSATIKKGETLKLTATVTPDTASGEKVTWISSDESVATVTDGTVTGKAKGTVTITASCGGKTATCEVTVQVPITSMRWWNRTADAELFTITMTEGDVVDIVACCTPKATSDNDIAITVADPQVVSVNPTEGIADDSSGRVDIKLSALKPGETTVTASAKGTQVSKSFTVTVVACVHADADGDGKCDKCGGSTVQTVPSLGDVDGKDGITATDAGYILQYVAKLITAEQINLELADVSGDGQISAADAGLVLQYVANLITTFPANNGN